MAYKIENKIYTQWDTDVRDKLKKEFPDRDIRIQNNKGTYQRNRYIRISTPYPDDKVNYEYSGGKMYLHVGDPKLRKTIHHSLQIRQKSDELEWGETRHGSCCLKNTRIDSFEALIAAFHQIANLFDPLLETAHTAFANTKLNEPYELPQNFKFSSITEHPSKEPVCCTHKNLRNIFHCQLVIPDYQRDYCWSRKEIQTLVQSLSEIKEGEPYHLGTIILHQKENEDHNYEYHVIDGQQRLTTLTLYLRTLGYEDLMPLLTQRFRSRQSVQHVAYAKYLLQGIVERMKSDPQQYSKLLADNITFSVLTLTGDNLDLAYTFFSNQNSKGVPLSDFDLLKAHHLRYIPIPAQAEHLAKSWNTLVNENSRVYSLNALQYTLGTHLFRLRHWLRKNSSSESLPRRIRDEYVAAPIMNGIPPFGERFIYSDKIQGGAHFFAYATHFVRLFHDFESTPQVSRLRQYICGRTHYRYADVIETLLFAYFLKFNKQYLSEALFCISSVMAGHRYTCGRALPDKIREYACQSELLLMIEQASSPTFFLAEALHSIKHSGLDLEEADIKDDFYCKLGAMFNGMPELTDMDIQQRINEEYQL